MYQNLYCMKFAKAASNFDVLRCKSFSEWLLKFIYPSLILPRSLDLESSITRSYPREYIDSLRAVLYPSLDNSYQYILLDLSAREHGIRTDIQTHVQSRRVIPMRTIVGEQNIQSNDVHSLWCTCHERVYPQGGNPILRAYRNHVWQNYDLLNEKKIALQFFHQQLICFPVDWFSRGNSPSVRNNKFFHVEEDSRDECTFCNVIFKFWIKVLICTFFFIWITHDEMNCLITDISSPTTKLVLLFDRTSQTPKLRNLGRS